MSIIDDALWMRRSAEGALIDVIKNGCLLIVFKKTIDESRFLKCCSFKLVRFWNSILETFRPNHCLLMNSGLRTLRLN